jgi:uncharacterized membrane protein
MKKEDAGPNIPLGTILAIAVLFFAITVWTSYAQWADFRYGTFDLAYYCQALWQFLHGRFRTTVLPVPLLGNHVEPIIFLIAPVFAIFRHPMIFVVLQNAALAAMGPISFDIGKRLGLSVRTASFLAASLLLAPAAGYIALHEFHPEALVAPLLLLMFRARLVRSLAQHWFWFGAVLACKENMALLLGAYCIVQLFVGRRRGLSELGAWYFWPLVVAVGWFLICVLVVTPALNAGSVDYGGLYSQIGSSAADIAIKMVIQPQLIGKALRQSLVHGNLVWGLLLPFLCLPLLKPRWLLIALPILLQHLLSWRSSEWTIYFHYAAPLLPLFWIGAAEAAADLRLRPRFSSIFQASLPPLFLLGALVGQAYWGPAREVSTATADWFSGRNERAAKNMFLDRIPGRAAVVAPLPYLSHLAFREKLYSLHYILKGLKTLSRTVYEPPPPPDFVLIDYSDLATFDAGSGYYHPTMKTTDGTIVPSSDQQLHHFLSSRRWTSYSENALTLLHQSAKSTDSKPAALTPNYLVEVGVGNRLISIAEEVSAANGTIDIKTFWDFSKGRAVFPWMFLQVKRRSDNKQFVIVRGLCAPEAPAGGHEDTWRITALDDLPAGDYSLEALFVDNTKRAWQAAAGTGHPQRVMLCSPISLGHIKIPLPTK